MNASWQLENLRWGERRQPWAYRVLFVSSYGPLSEPMEHDYFSEIMPDYLRREHGTGMAVEGRSRVKVDGDGWYDPMLGAWVECTYMRYLMIVSEAIYLTSFWERSLTTCAAREVGFSNDIVAKFSPV